MLKKIAASSIAAFLVATPHAANAQQTQPIKVGDHLVLKLDDKTHLCSPGLLVGNVLLTAGHCGPAGTPVFDENDNQLGTLEYFPDNPYDKERTAANDKGYVKLNVPTSREGGPVDPKNLEPYYGPIDKDNDEVCAWSTMANEERCGKIVGMYPGSIDYDFTMIKGDSGTAVYIKGKGTIATHGVSNHENGTAYGSLLPSMDVINEVTKPEGVDAPAEDNPDASADNGSENTDAPAEGNPDAPVEETPEGTTDNSESTDAPVEEAPEDTTDNTSEGPVDNDSEDPATPVDNEPADTTSENPEAPAEETTGTTVENTEGTTDNTAETTTAPVEENPTTLDPHKVYEQRVQPPAPDAENNYAVGTPEQQTPDNTGENNTQRTLASTGANVLLIAGIAALLLCAGITTALFRKPSH